MKYQDNHQCDWTGKSIITEILKLKASFFIPSSIFLVIEVDK